MLLCPALPGNEPQLGVPSHASLPRLKLHTPPGSPGFAPHPAWRAGAGLGRPLELCGWNLPERCPTAAANLWSWTRPSRPRLELGFFFFFSALRALPTSRACLRLHPAHAQIGLCLLSQRSSWDLP